MDTSHALQKFIFGKLTTDSGIAAVVAQRVYDRVPKSAVLPYIEFGDDEIQPEDAECLIECDDIYVTLHVWSRAPGRVEAKDIAGALVRALSEQEGTQNGYVIQSLTHDSTRILSDPDGLTTHAVVVFHAEVEPIAT